MQNRIDPVDVFYHKWSDLPTNEKNFLPPKVCKLIALIVNITLLCITTNNHYNVHVKFELQLTT